MGQDSPDWRRLAGEMERSLARQGLTWEQVSTRSGISTALLRNIRKGRSPVTPSSAAAIDRGFRWPDGRSMALLAGTDQHADGSTDATIAAEDVWAEEVGRQWRKIRDRRGIAAANAFLDGVLKDDSETGDGDGNQGKVS